MKTVRCCGRALVPVSVTAALLGAAPPAIGGEAYLAVYAPRPAEVIEWTAHTASHDGRAIAGVALLPGLVETHFVWTPDGGYRDIGFMGGLTGGGARITGVSSDGAVVVGYEFNIGASYRWTLATGWQQLPDLEGGREATVVNALSNDGTLAAGAGNTDRPNSSNTDSRAVTWSGLSGPTLLGETAGGHRCLTGYVNDMTSAGTIFVGTSDGGSLSQCDDQPAMWTNNGVQLLGDPDLNVNPSAVGVSSNGQHVVVSATTMFRWSGGYTDLGPLPDGRPSLSAEISADGDLIFADNNTIRGIMPYAWTPATGWQTVDQWLAAEAGLCDLDGWSGNSVFRIADDGSILGQGQKVGLGHNIWKLVYGCESGDTDGDGLCDDWEMHGIDVNGDGVLELDLPAMGADYMHKDLFVEVDWMRNVPYSQPALEEVIEAFRFSPVMNPDGQTGIKLHIDFATVEVLTRRAQISKDFAVDFGPIKNGTSGDGTDGKFGTAADRASDNWANIRCAKKRVFRYCLFADEFAPGFDGDSSPIGRAEMPGNDFIVALGRMTVVTDRDIAATFMHELGHNLNLGHGGGDHENFKPNYVSVMNYGFDQFVDSAGVGVPVDYSREAVGPLNEAAIFEDDGIASNLYANVYTFHAYIHPMTQDHAIATVRLNGQPHDYNQDGIFSIGPLPPINLNDMPPDFPGGPDENPQIESLIGFNDWDNLELPIGFNGDFKDGEYGTVNREEPTADGIEWLRANVPDPQPEPPLCRADLDGTGEVDVFDLLAYLDLWFNEAPGAEFTGDDPASINVFDLLAYLDLWFAGC